LQTPNGSIAIRAVRTSFRRSWSKPSTADASGPEDRRLREHTTNGVNAMRTFETTATVEEQGQVRVVVPFAPGTEVEVTISPKVRSEERVMLPDDEGLVATRGRMQELFRTIKGFRNSPRIPREELHERGSLR
jgi:hypothetical protein